MNVELTEDTLTVSAEIVKTKAEVTETAFKAIIKGKDTPDTTWKETADVASYSATGAGFYMPRECRVGTIVALMIPLPEHMRAYDHDKDLYRVLGLVQHCHPLSGEDANGYHVGVAFIGKNAPDSYRADPQQSFKICGMNELGLWKITEARSQFKARRHVRFWTNVEPYMALIDAQRDSVSGERCNSENISKNGAAVFSNLDVNVGDRLKFICEKFDFSGLAVVCNRNLSTEGTYRLHLQFVENSFPVDKLRLDEVASQSKK